MKKVAIIVAVFLLLGCFPLPSGYYTFLRIIVTIGGAVSIVVNWDKGLNWVNIVLGIIVILFNPIFPVYLDEKMVWVIIDALCGGFFLYLGLRRFK